MGIILGLLAYFTYKLSQLQEMEDQEIGILIVTNLAMLFLIKLFISM